MNFIKIIKHIVIALLLLPSFCGKEKPNGPSQEEQINLLIEEGWTNYTNQEYSNAILKFEEIFALERNNTKAYLGRGWSRARSAFGSNDEKYDEALLDFEKILITEPENIDAYAGIAFILIIKNQYDNAINAANFVLERDSSYVFSYDNTITATDLLLILAQSYYYSADYTKVVEMLTILEPETAHPGDKPEILLSQIQALWRNE